MKDKLPVIDKDDNINGLITKLIIKNIKILIIIAIILLIIF